MASFSDYLENKILDHITGKTSFTMPGTVAIALTQTTPTDASLGTEVPNTNSYARKVTAASDWNAAGADGITENGATITFATPSGTWGTAVGFALMDSGAFGGGNMLAWGTLTTSQAIGTGNTVSFAAGALVISLD